MRTLKTDKKRPAANRQPGAMKKHCSSASVMAKTQAQCSAYLTDPAYAGFTVTVSWGLAPRSAAGGTEMLPDELPCSI